MVEFLYLKNVNFFMKICIVLLIFSAPCNVIRDYHMGFGYRPHYQPVALALALIMVEG